MMGVQCLYCLILGYLSCMYASLPLSQPTVIEILDEATFTLNVEYCAFTAYDSNNIIVISLNTRCYCFDTDFNKDFIKFRTNINALTSPTTTKPLNTSNKALLCSIPGPTLIIKNGITFDINLVNNLVGSAFDTAVSYPYEIRNWPDVVNLHTHGLHVSPKWDNVFQPINPVTTKTLHYEVPYNHYPGTHWYHAHFHQATELQIQGGLFGAMIVETDDDNGFYEDIILEFHFMFFYTTSTCNCDQDEGELMNQYCYIRGFWDLCSLCFNWCANPQQRLDESDFIYSAESIYADDNGKVDIPLVNAQFQPSVTIEAGKWYRLRLINSNGQYYTQLKWPTHQCQIYIIAADGIYFQDGPRDILDVPWEKENIFDPGSRNDIAIRCDILHTGDHAVYYSQNGTQFNILPRFPDDVIAFTIHVILPLDEIQRDTVKDPPKYVIPPLPEYLFDSYNNEAESPYKITDWCPCWTYEGGQYNLKCHWNLGRFGTSINGQMWNGPNQPILYVCRGEIYQFEINSLHPLHIHTSPFQLMQDLPKEGPKMGFLSKAGDFRDTTSSDFGDFYIRYQATDFTGPIVTHCHFLPHEDEGMMVYFQVVECDDNGNRPFMDIVNGTLNPYGYDPTLNKNVLPDECHIFEHPDNI